MGQAVPKEISPHQHHHQLSPSPSDHVHQIPTPPQSYSSTGSSPASSRVYHNGSGGHRSTSRRRLSSSSTSSKDGNGPLNTNSPIALAAAAAVTPDKLAKLLLTQGPLAIRHITSHLALTIPGFADLSLSKQRRLIIAVLDNEDPVNGVIFEKVGWGRWAARRTDGSSPQPHHVTPHQPYTKSKRRESITAGDLVKPPMSPSLNPVFGDDVDLADDDMMFHNKPNGSNNNDHYGAVFDDEDEDDEDLEDSDDEDGLRKPYHHRRSSSRRHSSIARHAVSQHHRNNHRHSETDEEDWQSIGAASLRRNSHSPASFGFSTSYTRKNNFPFDAQKEKEAVDALVQLSSI